MRQYRPFEEARAFARNLCLRNFTEWRKYCRGEMSDKPLKPDDVPAAPGQVYKDKGWISWGDWLGTGTVATYFREYRPFEEARAFVRSLGLKSQPEWRKYCRGEIPGKPPKPDDVPAAPGQIYKDKGWSSMGDWLGTGTVATHLRQYRPFEEARAFVRSLGLKSSADWQEYCRGEMPGKPPKPADIPTNPNSTYKNKGWFGIGDWLGTGTVATHLRQYRPFEEARAFARNLCLRNFTEWRKYCRGEMPDKERKPDDIPAAVARIYKDKGWISWGDWLGTGTVWVGFKQYRPFEDARAFVRTLGLKNSTEWQKYCRGEMPDKPPRPDDLPASSHNFYKDKGWINWPDWLGTAKE
jgi:hypothetical protein